MQQTRAFTLIELLTVIAIIAVVAAVATPGFLAWRLDRDFSAGLRRTISTMKTAQMRSVKENARALVIFDIKKNHFTAFVDNSGDKSYNPDTDRFIDAYNMPPGVHIIESTFTETIAGQKKHRFGYNSRGLPSRPGRVRIGSNRGRLVDIVVARTGRIRIERVKKQG